MERIASPVTNASTSDAGADLDARAGTVAAVAARHADEVDAAARFPREAIEAARQARLLSAALPVDLGGGGHTMQALAAMCTTVACSCGSSGMVLAMHHIQVACMARHGRGTAYFERYLTEVAGRQLLLASVTSEVGTGGDTRSSICAVELAGDRFTLAKDATTVSYAEQADDLLVTCRRAPEAEQGDQLLVLLRKGDYSLRRTGEWNTLGMRGTCSPAYHVSSAGPAAQIIPGSFAEISAQSMVPFSHILWSAVWLGIASGAVARAAACVRAEARRKPGTVPATAIRLAEVSVQLQALRQHVAATAAEFDGLGGDVEALSTMRWALKLNNLKIAASEAAPRIVHQALQVIGIMGYRNDTPFSVGRHYRDVLSGALMVGNDRIASKNASLLLVLKDE